MIIFSAYMVKVILCSALLYGFYFLVLRNKKSHDFNRFYLLGISLFSWILPLLKFEIIREQITEAPKAFQLLEVVNNSSHSFENIVMQGGNYFTWTDIANLVFIVGSMILLMFLFNSIRKNFTIVRTSPSEKKEGATLIYSDAQGTPFSFFNFIFWNKKIDIDSKEGIKILQHELIHVKEKHSLDKILMQLVIVAGWYNPIFWLIKNELHLVHEFIADGKSLAEGDSHLLAEILLKAIFPQEKFSVTNSFFYSPIKRRLKMINKKSNFRLDLLRKGLILMLVVVTTCLFAFRMKENSNSSGPLNKTYTIAIDAGHGGVDDGGRAVDGQTEKAFALSIANKVKALNNNSNIKILMIRENDEWVELKERKNIIDNANADLMVSIHVGANPNLKHNGVDVYVPLKNDEWKNKSVRFASIIGTNLGSTFSQLNGVLERQMGVWLLNNVTCPAVLIECGYLTNKNDLQILSTKQDEIALNILKSINDYLASKE